MTVDFTLEAMKFHAFHGLTTEERTIGGLYLVDISYAISTDAVETDRIENTVNYAELFDLVKAAMLESSHLIEHVAGRILKAIQAQFPQIKSLTVKVSKLNPPINGEMANVSATLKS